jgi:uncharacterized UBP type Zn finger protein
MHGFYNNGNTCYFNTAIQCMLHVHQLSEHIINKPYGGECAFTQSYTELTRIYFQNEKHVKIDIEPLLKRFQDKFPQFKSKQQHDTQEALFCIIDILEATYPYLKQLIYGEKQQITICPSGTKTERVPFCILLLHCDGDEGKSVSELVSASEKWDVLDDYVDDLGTKHHVSTTRTSIIKYPPVLLISFDSKSRVLPDPIYERYEVSGSIIHLGNQCGGHYISMIKLNAKWFMQDDTNVSIVDFPSVPDSHHVLIYNALKSSI